jgi:glycine cleavage system regulatory protein
LAAAAMNDVVLTLIGPDRPGLVEAVAEIVAAHGGNWLESRMAHLAGKFAGVLRAEVPPEQREALTRALAGLETRGLKVVVETGAPRQAAGRTLALELVGLDRPGLVKEISQLLAAHGVNVEELTTDRTSAPMSGEMLFRARARLHVPANVALDPLRAGLDRLESDLMVEIKLDE